jgi:hypothetical protein
VSLQYFHALLAFLAAPLRHRARGEDKADRLADLDRPTLAEILRYPVPCCEKCGSTAAKAYVGNQACCRDCGALR